MTKKLAILQKYEEGNDWFLKSKYPISYRLAILLCFYDDIKSHKLNQASFASEISKACEYMQNLSVESFKSFKGDYFSIYQFDDCSDSPAVFFVDHSHNCFPLVFYSDKNTTDKKEFRLTALKQCLDLIDQNNETLFNLLNKSNGWDQPFQEKILELIPEPKIGF